MDKSFFFSIWDWHLALGQFALLCTGYSWVVGMITLGFNETDESSTFNSNDRMVYRIVFWTLSARRNPTLPHACIYPFAYPPKTKGSDNTRFCR